MVSHSYYDSRIASSTLTVETALLLIESQRRPFAMHHGTRTLEVDNRFSLNNIRFICQQCLGDDEFNAYLIVKGERFEGKQQTSSQPDSGSEGGEGVPDDPWRIWNCEFSQFHRDGMSALARSD